MITKQKQKNQTKKQTKYWRTGMLTSGVYEHGSTLSQRILAAILQPHVELDLI